MAKQTTGSPSWLYEDGDFRGKSYVFPSDDVNPDVKKEPQWCMAWAKAIYAKMLNNQAYTSLDRMVKYELLRSYALGSQPREKYMDWLLGDVSQNPTRKGYYNMDFQIFSPMPAYIRKVVGRLESQEHKLTVNAIDPLSGTEREDMMWDSYFELQYGKIMESIKANAKISTEDEGTKYVPASKEELESFNQAGGFKLTHEIDMEKALNYTDYVSDTKEIKRKCLFDLIAINCAAYRDVIDLDGTVKYEYLDFARLIIDANRENGFKNSRFWGYMKFENIATIRAKTGLKEAVLMQYCRKYAEWFGNPAWSMGWGEVQNSVDLYDPVTGTYVYDNYLVPVIDCEMLSVDTSYKTKRTTKYGTMVYAPSAWGEEVDKPNKKSVTVSIPQVYKCSWIVGSDICYDYGQQTDIPRFGEKKMPRLSVHAYALPGKSMTEQCMGPLDQVQLAYLKMQNAMAQAKPSGLAIEFSTLNNINLGDGDMTPLNIIDMYMATGTYVYSAVKLNGKPNFSQGKPIEEIVGGIGPLLNEIDMTFNMQFNFISELTGIERFAGATQKGGEVSATQINEVSASANDAMQPIYSAWLSIRESGARNGLQKIWMQIKYRNGYDVYYPIMGSATIENFRISREYADRTYGLKVEALPSSNYTQIILQAATEALKPGKDGENISMGDYLLIVDMAMKGMLKQARMLLNYRLEIRKQQALKIQKENIELQGQQSRMLQQEKAKQDAEKLKGEMLLEAVRAFLSAATTEHAENEAMKAQLMQTLIAPLLAPQPTATAA